jgi:phosphatidylglycerol:prolipoprotein diacylglycerol transferase
MPLAYWTHDLSPFLVRFGEDYGIRWYGLAYLAGFVGAAWLLNRYHKAGRSTLDLNAILDLITALVVGVMAGGRIGYFLLYQPATLATDPLILVRVWEGGMASHGGMLGVAVAIWWFTRRRAESILHVSDLVLTAVPLGLFFGRVANFINGELWGKITDISWAVIFPASPLPLMPRHPSQLYEAFFEGLVLLAWMQWRFWKTDIVRRQPGRLTGEFFIGYSLGRAFCELYREPDAALILGMSRGTFYSLFLIVAGVALIAYAGRKSERKA